MATLVASIAAREVEFAGTIEHFVDELSLADVHVSLEHAADVLSTVKGSQVQGRQRHR